MQQAAHRVVFFEDGYLHEGCDLTPQQVLTRHSSGVYTTALITPEGQVVDWSLHRKRLLRGVEILNRRPSRPFQPLLSSLDSQGSSLPDFFDAHVLPVVRAGLEAFYGPPPPTSPPQHAMLVVCISPSPSFTAEGSPAAAAAAATTSAATASGTAGTSAGATREPTPGCSSSSDLPCNGPSADGYGDQLRSTGQPAGIPAAVGDGDDGVNSSRSSSAGAHARVAVYCKAVQPPPYGPEHAVQAAVLGRPRLLPGAKAASWVQERRGYEERKPAEAAEVLLSDADGRILEGLVTNFYVIAHKPTDADAAAAAATASGSPGGDADAAQAAAGAVRAPAAAGAAPSGATAAGAEAAVGPRSSSTPPVVLRLCGPQSDAALPGVVQCRVVEAARRLGLEVVPEPPSAAERGTWREAFVSNCIKRLQPLSRVFCPPGNAWGVNPWDCWLPQPAGPHTTALLRELERIEERTPWREL